MAIASSFSYGMVKGRTNQLKRGRQLMTDIKPHLMPCASSSSEASACFFSPDPRTGKADAASVSRMPAEAAKLTLPFKIDTASAVSYNGCGAASMLLW